MLHLRGVRVAAVELAHCQPPKRASRLLLHRQPPIITTIVLHTVAADKMEDVEVGRTADGVQARGVHIVDGDDLHRAHAGKALHTCPWVAHQELIA